jgi:hypothetical protein
MRIFLGWSGDLSRQLADAFHDWLKCVIQDVDPFLSTRDLDKGAAWQSLLTDTLKDCSFGIFFLTNDNLSNMWMHFEAGALLKQIGKSKVCPFLFNVVEAEMDGPFAFFQATRFDQDDIYKLVRSINSSLANPVSDGILRECFQTFWPKLERRLIDIRSDEHPEHRATRADPKTLQVQELKALAAQLLEHDSLHAFGLRQVVGTRLQSLQGIRRELDSEGKEIVIIGSSLKGIIGVGGDSAGEQNLVRISLIDALKRNVRIKMLVTHPEVAHHRSKQEGRERGEIEREIIDNLIYLTKERRDSKEVESNLEIKLYNGAPTIFLLCTSRAMFFNPYTFYSKAYESLCFEAEAGSGIYEHYYHNHYLAAWNDNKLTIRVKAETQQLRALINGKNQHNEPIIPDDETKEDLLTRLERIDRKE